MSFGGRGGGFGGRGGAARGDDSGPPAFGRGGSFRGVSSRPSEDEGGAGGGNAFGGAGRGFGRNTAREENSGAPRGGRGDFGKTGGDDESRGERNGFGPRGGGFPGRGGGANFGGGGGRDFGDEPKPFTRGEFFRAPNSQPASDNNDNQITQSDNAPRGFGRQFGRGDADNSDSSAPRGRGSSFGGDNEPRGGGRGFGGRGGFGKQEGHDSGGGGGGFGARGGRGEGFGGGRGGSFGRQDGEERGGRSEGFGSGRGGGFGGRGGSFGGGAGRDFGDNDRGNRGSGFGGRGGGGAGRDFGDDRGGRRFGGDRDGSDFGFGAARGERRIIDRDGSGSDDLFFRSNRAPREYATDEERLRDQSHVPTTRTIDEIVQEDLHAADSYLQIREEDDNVAIAGDQANPETIIEKWEEAKFEPKLLENVERSKYVVPRKIQSLAIPLIMDGHDIKGHSETGSGKSAAFLLPIIDTIMKKKASGDFKSKRSHPYALIIEPTRELCIQLHEQAKKLADNTEVTVAKAYGKYLFKHNLREISLGCDILIGTPGRLIQLFHEKYVMLEFLKIFVLDEADQLLDDQFARDLRMLEKMEGFPKKEDRQTLLFSATFPPEVQLWAQDWLRDTNIMVSNKKPASANAKVRQEFHIVPQAQKTERLLKILKDEIEEARKLKAEANAEKKDENAEEGKENVEMNGEASAEGDKETATGSSGPETKKDDEVMLRRTLVFVKMKRTADVVAAYLCNNDIKATTINGDRPQKLREESLDGFRKNKFNVVIATDVCARGIDIKDLDHVINLDLPDDHIIYVHRIGRTGRLKEGHATSFFDPVQDNDTNLAKELVRIVKEVDQEPPEFLVQASEGTLSYVNPDEYGFGKGPDAAENKEDAAAASDDEGAKEAAPDATSAPAAKNENDEWD